MDYLEILRKDVLEYLLKDVKGENIEDRHEEIETYVSEKMNDLKKSILDECNDKKKYKNPKDRKAVFDDFLDGFDSLDWKKYFKYKGTSPYEIRILKHNCLVKSSVTENLLEGINIVPKSKDFYSVYLDYCGWNDFTKKKSKNKHHKNNRSKFPKFLTDYVPQIEEDEIEGRRDELKKLHKLLSIEKKVVVMNSMGGIGKTTLASVYATKYESEYNHIVWINQNFESTFKNDFVYSSGLQKRLNILEKNRGKDLDEIYLNIVRTLDSIEDEPCLMVIDNADEGLSHFRNILPKKTKWHILITSREKIPLFDEVVNLDFLNLEDAVKLFKRNYGRVDINDNIIQEIVKDLDFHTLTIEILAKTAKKRDQLPSSILEFLKKNMRADLNVRHNKGRRNKKIERVTNYLCEIFNKIECLSDDNKWLLQQLSCLPPEYHNYKKILKELITREEFDLRENLEDLLEGGWLQYDSEKDDYKLHRIVIEVVHRSIPFKVETIVPILSSVIIKLPVTWEKENPTAKFKWIQFGETLLNLFKTDEDLLITEINTLQNNVASNLFALGGKDNLRKAKYWFEKAKDTCERDLGETHPTTAVIYSNLVLLLRELGGRDNLLVAKNLGERAKNINEKNFGEKHSTTRFTYTNLALVHQDLGGTDNLHKALHWIKKVKDADEQNFGENHPTTAITYSNLASVFQALKGTDNLQEAKYWLKKSIEVVEENFGKNHPTTGVCYSNLALVLRGLGKKDNLEEAKYFGGKAKDIAEENFGKNHPTTAACYSNLAVVLLDIGGRDNLYKAKDWLEKTKDFNEENYGEKHPKTETSYTHLASVFQALGGKYNLEEAKYWLRKAIDSAEENFGQKHPTTGVHYFNLARVLQNLGGNDNLQEAKDWLEKVLEIVEISLGADQSLIKVIQGNIENIKSLLNR